MGMKYTSDDVAAMVDDFRALPAETAWLEFKMNMADSVQIAKYISALSNMATYSGRSYGYLIWGIDNETHAVEGTSFDWNVVKAEKNQPLELWLRLVVKPQISYDFFEGELKGKRIVLLEIEAAYRQPVTFKGVAWARIGSAVTEMSKDPKIAAAIYGRSGKDWSAEIVPTAAISDLEPKAIELARRQYADKHKDDIFAPEISGWDDITFLNKAKLAIDGKLTRAALLLLGKSEKAYLIAPAVSRITWHLKDKDENSVDYKHFDMPLILAVDQVLARIRSLTLREMPEGTLFPVEINQYDQWVLREALHNCIAHQDYGRCSTIVVTEYPDRVRFANSGDFYPGSVEAVLRDNGRPRIYPNKQLADAMVELKMIDTLGSGIRRMFVRQRERFMPMPDYDLGNGEVIVEMPGRIIDARYCKLLMANTELTMEEILLLDKIQKHVRIDKAAADRLRKKDLVGGRYPNLYPAVSVAKKVDGVEGYLEAKAFDDEFYMQHVLEYICAKGQVTRQQIDKFLLKHMSSVLSEDQKKTKIGNLLSLRLRKRYGWIENIGGRSNSCWVLTTAGCEQCRKGNEKCERKCKKGKS